MKTITETDLKNILARHKMWLNDNPRGERADLRNADLSYADLSYADLRYAGLSYADLSYAKIDCNLIDKFFPICCPGDGAFIGWKKCRDGLVVKLEICDTAKRSSAWGRKCRCSAAKVLAIYDGENECTEAHSIYNNNFVYRVGEIVSVEDFDDNRLNECSSGIHFFITRKEAEDYDG